MREAEVRLKGWMIADTLAELRIWLDLNNCVPPRFDITRAGTEGLVVVRVKFSEDAKAEAFQREFGR
jgi:hypothetical protein